MHTHAMSHDASELPVLVPVQQDGRTAGGRRRNDVLALVVVEDVDRDSVLSAAATAGLVVMEASSVDQAVSLLERVGFDLVMTSTAQLPALRERLEVEFFGSELPVLVDAAAFCTQTVTIPETLPDSGMETGDTRSSLGELAALCSFTSTPMTLLLVTIENPEAGALEHLALKRLLSCVREGDVVGKWEDGTLVVGLGEAGREDATAVVRRIREALASSPALLPGDAVEYLNISLGSASGSPDLAALEAQATQALATARLSGPGRAVLLP